MAARPDKGNPGRRAGIVSVARPRFPVRILLCAALLGFLLFGLGLHVSLSRQRGPRAIDALPGDPLHETVRAHGNTAGYAPVLLSL